MLHGFVIGGGVLQALLQYVRVAVKRCQLALQPLPRTLRLKTNLHMMRSATGRPEVAMQQ